MIEASGHALLFTFATTEVALLASEPGHAHKGWLTGTNAGVELIQSKIGGMVSNGLALINLFTKYQLNLLLVNES